MSKSGKQQPAVASIQGVAGTLQQDRDDGEHETVQGVVGNCSKHNIVKEGNSFQVYLRVLGV